MICLPLSWYQLTRPVRRRRAVRRYERHLRTLRRIDDGESRANCLDVMAMIAETLSIMTRDRESAAWSVTSELLRCVAATERYMVLAACGPHSENLDIPAIAAAPGLVFVPPIVGAAWRDRWEALAAAAWAGDSRERARILAGLAGAAIDVPGVLVLDDIAETELAIPGPLPETVTAGPDPVLSTPFPWELGPRPGYLDMPDLEDDSSGTVQP